MAVLNKFCFCWDVKKGSLIVAIGTLVITIITIILLILGLVGVYAGKFEDGSGNTKYEIGKANVIFIWFTLVVSCIFLLLTVLLIIGIRRDRLGFILPWIIWTFVGLTISFIDLCLTVDKVGKTNSIGVFLVRIFFFFLQIYFVLCVISHYQNLKESSAGSSSYKA